MLIGHGGRGSGQAAQGHLVARCRLAYLGWQWEAHLPCPGDLTAAATAGVTPRGGDIQTHPGELAESPAPVVRKREAVSVA